MTLPSVTKDWRIIYWKKEPTKLNIQYYLNDVKYVWKNLAKKKKENINNSCLWEEGEMVIFPFFKFLSIFSKFSIMIKRYGAPLVAQTVKNLPAVQETWVRSLGGEDALEKGMAPHSNVLAWRILWTEESGGLWSMGSQRVRDDWATNVHTLLYIIV